jgi:hypothetical protein
MEQVNSVRPPLGYAGRQSAIAMLNRRREDFVRQLTTAAEEVSTVEPWDRELTRPKAVRDWKGTRRLRCEVSVKHPQYGNILRGWISSAPSPDWRCGWTVTTFDHELVGDGPMFGDYLDAEAALLDATTELDEEVTAS